MRIPKEVITSYYQSSKRFQDWFEGIPDEILLVDYYGRPIVLNKIYFHNHFYCYLTEISIIKINLSDNSHKKPNRYESLKWDVNDRCHYCFPENIYVYYDTYGHFSGLMLQRDIIQLPLKTYEDICIEAQGIQESQELKDD